MFSLLHFITCLCFKSFLFVLLSPLSSPSGITHLPLITELQKSPSLNVYTFILALVFVVFFPHLFFSPLSLSSEFQMAAQIFLSLTCSPSIFSFADEIDMLERLWLSGICHNDKIEV